MSKSRRVQLGSGSQLKLVLLGDGAVGKTTLVKSWMNETFSSNYLMTVGVDISTKQLQLKNGGKIKLTVSDVAGQERFAQFRSVFFNGANLAFLVFDVTRAESLQSLETSWIPQLVETLTDENFHVLLIANKIDLDQQRQVQTDQIRTAYKRLKKGFPMMTFIGFIETSALHKHNVNEAFQIIVEKYLIKKAKKNKTPTI